MRGPNRKIRGRLAGYDSGRVFYPRYEGKQWERSFFRVTGDDFYGSEDEYTKGYNIEVL